MRPSTPARPSAGARGGRRAGRPGDDVLSQEPPSAARRDLDDLPAQERSGYSTCVASTSPSSDSAMWRIRTVEASWATSSRRLSLRAVTRRASWTTASVCRLFWTTAKLSATRPTASTVRQATKMTNVRVRRERCAARRRVRGARYA